MNPRILIVEDEPAIADTLHYALETDGFQALCTQTGAEALAALAREKVDLIVLDVGLPDANGFELCKKIRESHTTPIIFLTARADEIDRVVGLEIGGDDYVTKPFSPRELTARVKAVLRRTAVGGQATGTSNPPGAFQVDDSRRRVTYYGQLLDLSRYEYNLLKIFIARPGHVYSRDQLMVNAWDDPEASMDRTVDAHIKNIRGKLKAVQPEIDPIVTHRGMGYSLKEGL